MTYTSKPYIDIWTDDGHVMTINHFQGGSTMSYYLAMGPVLHNAVEVAYQYLTRPCSSTDERKLVLDTLKKALDLASPDLPLMAPEHKTKNLGLILAISHQLRKLINAK